MKSIADKLLLKLETIFRAYFSRCLNVRCNALEKRIVTYRRFVCLERLFLFTPQRCATERLVSWHEILPGHSVNEVYSPGQISMKVGRELMDVSSSDNVPRASRISLRSHCSRSHFARRPIFKNCPSRD